MKKKIECIVWIAIFVFVCIIFQAPWNVNKTVSATLIKLDEKELNIPIDVKIEWKYYVNLLKGDAFKGKVCIEGVDYEGYLGDVSGGYPLRCRESEDLWIGVYAENGFRSFCIALPAEDGEWSSKSGACIVSDEGIKVRMYKGDIEM